MVKYGIFMDSSCLSVCTSVCMLVNFETITVAVLFFYFFTQYPAYSSVGRESLVLNTLFLTHRPLIENYVLSRGTQRQVLPSCYRSDYMKRTHSLEERIHKRRAYSQTTHR